MLSLCYPASAVFAVQIPDAGSLMRDQQPRKELQQQLPEPEATKDESGKASHGVRVEVKGFTFSGYEGVSTEEELQGLVADARGKSLYFSELIALADRITRHLEEEGWTQARAYLPAQDITSGIVQIAVSQIKSDGKIIIKRDKTVRVNDPILLGYGQSAVRSGQQINLRQLERSLLLINDLPGVSANASLAPGEAPGTNGVEIGVAEGPLFSGSAWADNQGNRYTGVWRGNASLSINDPLRRGDQVTLLLTEASGLVQGRVGYSIPIAHNGIRFNLSYTGMRYELGEELAALNYTGHSNSIDAGFSYPLIRTRKANLTASATYGFRSFIDTWFDTDIRDSRIDNATISLYGDRYDQFFGGGQTSYNLGVTTGTLHESIADISRTGTEGTYTRINMGLVRQQRLGDRVEANLSGSAQLSTGNLGSGEKMSLGGPNGVRAYPIGEASGDEGQLINAEIRSRIPLPSKWGGLQLSCFYDAGHITLNKNRYSYDVSNATDSNDYWLLGAGVGLNYTYSRTFSLRANWAHVIGDNPGRSAAGNNSDGQSSKSRFWLHSTLSF
jgi:hemolysin activation/secretion protein